jgi:peptidoglycan/LPS O-acetylase OafA/YrhL
MRRLLREAAVTIAAALCLAGPVAAAVVPLSPPAWRRPQLVWAILLGSIALVVRIRRGRWRAP